MPRRAIVIYPPKILLEEIERVRAKFDPRARDIAAHITLVFPFDAELSSVELHGHLEFTLKQTQAFSVRLADPTGHDGGYISLGVADGREALIALHDLLYAGALARHLSRQHRYSPHLTLGHIEDGRRFLDALADVSHANLAVEFDVREVAVFLLDGPTPPHTEFTVSLLP